MTDGVIDGAVYDLISMEPMVYNEYDVFANIDNGNSEDYNRMSAKFRSANDTLSNALLFSRCLL